MSTKRIRLTKPVITTRAEAEALVAEIADLMNQHRQAAAELDAGINGLRENFAGRLSALERAMDEKTTVAQAWAEAHPSEFNGAKSLDMACAVIGWRTGKHQLKTLAGWTWDRVLEKLQMLRLAEFIRRKEEVNKQAIIDCRETLDGERLREMGCKIVQEEAFFVEPKLSAQEERVTAAA